MAPLFPYQDALLILDLQPDFMPGGALPVHEGDAIVEPIAAFIKRHPFQTIVATQDFHPHGHVSFASRHGRPPYSSVTLSNPEGPAEEQTLWPEHCVQGSIGAELHAGLPLHLLHLILRKGTHVDADSYSAFRENRGLDGQRRTTGLGAFLRARGVTRVFVCGLARDFCVAWTAFDAAAEGFAAVVLDDLTRAVFPERAAETDAAFATAGVLHLSSRALAS